MAANGTLQARAFASNAQLPLPQDVAQEITEEVGYLVQTGVIPNFPGQILRLGDSDT